MKDTEELDPTDPLRVVCPRCVAWPGYVCRTATGRRAHQAHQDRIEPLAIAYGIGYATGYETGYNFGESRARKG